MDMWLRMAWHDQRLAHHLDRPVLINDENILKYSIFFKIEYSRQRGDSDNTKGGFV